MRAVSVSRRMACSSIQHRAIAGMTILPLFGMLARMWHIPDGLLTPTTEDYGCATIIGRLWLPKRVQRLRTGLQPCLRRQPRAVDEQPRRSPEDPMNQNTERGDSGLIITGPGASLRSRPTRRYNHGTPLSVKSVADRREPNTRLQHIAPLTRLKAPSAS